MAAVFTYGWCRVEGCKIPDLRKEYGELVNLPAALGSSVRVFYGTPEVQIFNALNVNGGVVYKVVTIKEMLGYESIQEIDANWYTLLNHLKTCDKKIDISDAPNSANYYYEPFTINEPCIIFYDNADRATTEANQFSYREIILVDEIATPSIITLVGSYTGKPVPVGETYDTKDLDMYVVYSDGNKAILKQGFTVSPADQIIHNVGSNVVEVQYVAPNGSMFTASVIVTGIKNLVSIEATYDGPNVGYGQEAKRKYFIVVAHYSDESSSTVTDFIFPSGNIVSETNGGVISIYYNGFYTSAAVPTYDVTTSRLIAYYNGPNVEIGHDFMPSYCTIKIYYQASDGINSHYEDISTDLCTFTPTMVDHEGVNYVTVEYTGKLGTIKTKMIVVGITPEVKLNFITAEYTGPEITVGKSYSAERVVCKAHYSDGSVVNVRNFALSGNVVSFVGPNEYVVIFTNKDEKATTTITVIGLEKDSTTESGYSPIYLQNSYPEATRQNNRYRGPAEGYKHNETLRMFYDNITRLYRIFYDIEQEFNKVANTLEGNDSIKARTLNTIDQMNTHTDKWLTDDRFISGMVKGGKA